MSGMFLKYGDHSHAVGECDIAIAIETLETEGGTPYAHRHRWTVSGLLTGADADEIDEKVIDLKTAYRENDRDLTILLPDGASASTQRLVTAGAIGGVRVVSTSFPTMARAGYVTNYRYQIVLEAEIPLDDPETALRSFNETLTFSGGGPRYGHLETLTGPPVKQLLRRQTIYRVEQSGQAVGLYARPTPPLPIWPAAQIESGARRLTSPKRRRNEYTDLAIDWSFRFESAGPLIGSPHVWGVNY
jgi:hypothetical protein